MILFFVKFKISLVKFSYEKNLQHPHIIYIKNYNTFLLRQKKKENPHLFASRPTIRRSTQIRATAGLVSIGISTTRAGRSFIAAAASPIALTM